MNPDDFLRSPYHRFLRLEIVSWQTGQVEMRIPFRDELLRRSDSDWLHGGIVAALIDIAGNAAVSSVTGSSVPTIDMRVDYLRPSRGSLSATSRAVKVGRTVGVSDVEVRDSSGDLVATGRAVYAIPKPEAKAQEQA